MVSLDTFLAQLNLFYIYSPFGLEAHAQVPRHHPVPLDSGDKGSIQPSSNSVTAGFPRSWMPPYSHRLNSSALEHAVAVAGGRFHKAVTLRRPVAKSR